MSIFNTPGNDLFGPPEDASSLFGNSVDDGSNLFNSLDQGSSFIDDLNNDAFKDNYKEEKNYYQNQKSDFDEESNNLFGNNSIGDDFQANDMFSSSQAIDDWGSNTFENENNVGDNIQQSQDSSLFGNPDDSSNLFGEQAKEEYNNQPNPIVSLFGAIPEEEPSSLFGTAEELSPFEAIAGNNLINEKNTNIFGSKNNDIFEPKPNSSVYVPTKHEAPTPIINEMKNGPKSTVYIPGKGFNNTNVPNTGNTTANVIKSPNVFVPHHITTDVAQVSHQTKVFVPNQPPPVNLSKPSPNQNISSPVNPFVQNQISVGTKSNTIPTNNSPSIFMPPTSNKTIQGNVGAPPSPNSIPKPSPPSVFNPSNPPNKISNQPANPLSSPNDLHHNPVPNPFVPSINSNNKGIVSNSPSLFDPSSNRVTNPPVNVFSPPPSNQNSNSKNVPFTTPPSNPINGKTQITSTNPFAPPPANTMNNSPSVFSPPTANPIPNKTPNSNVNTFAPPPSNPLINAPKNGLPPQNTTFIPPPTNPSFIAPQTNNITSKLPNPGVSPFSAPPSNPLNNNPSNVQYSQTNNSTVSPFSPPPSNPNLNKPQASILSPFSQPPPNNIPINKVPQPQQYHSNTPRSGDIQSDSGLSRGISFPLDNTPKQVFFTPPTNEGVNPIHNPPSSTPPQFNLPRSQTADLFQSEHPSFDAPPPAKVPETKFIHSVSQPCNVSHSTIPYFHQKRPLFAFGFAGQIISVKNDQSLEIRTIKTAFPNSSIVNQLSTFSTTDANMVETFITNRINACESATDALLWSALRVRYGHKNTIDPTLFNTNSKVNGSAEFQLISQLSHSGPNSNVIIPEYKQTIIDKQKIEQLQAIIIEKGESNALEFCINNSLWDFALAISSSLGEIVFKKTTDLFLNSTTNICPLQNIIRAITGTQSKPTADNWRNSLATIVKHYTPSAILSLKDMADYLEQNGSTQPSHLCRLLASEQIGQHPSSFSLVGADWKYPTVSSIQMSQLSMTKTGFHFYPYALFYTMALIDYGFLEMAKTNNERLKSDFENSKSTGLHRVSLSLSKRIDSFIGIANRGTFQKVVSQFDRILTNWVHGEETSAQEEFNSTKLPQSVSYEPLDPVESYDSFSSPPEVNNNFKNVDRTHKDRNSSDSGYDKASNESVNAVEESKPQKSRPLPPPEKLKPSKEQNDGDQPKGWSFFGLFKSKTTVVDLSKHEKKAFWDEKLGKYVVEGEENKPDLPPPPPVMKPKFATTEPAPPQIPIPDPPLMNKPVQNVDEPAVPPPLSIPPQNSSLPPKANSRTKTRGRFVEKF